MWETGIEHVPDEEVSKHSRVVGKFKYCELHSKRSLRTRVVVHYSRLPDKGWARASPLSKQIESIQNKMDRRGLVLNSDQQSSSSKLWCRELVYRALEV